MKQHHPLSCGGVCPSSSLLPLEGNVLQLLKFFILRMLLSCPPHLHLWQFNDLIQLNNTLCTNSKERWKAAPRAHNKGLEFWQTINNAITLYDSIPADCLEKVVRRNLEDTQAEILFDKQQPNDREVHRVILKESSAANSREDSLSKERISMKLKPVTINDDGVSKAAIAQDTDKQAFISKLVTRHS